MSFALKDKNFMFNYKKRRLNHYFNNKKWWSFYEMESKSIVFLSHNQEIG